MPEENEERIPKKARELFEKGMAALERNNYSYALDMLGAAVDMAPHFPPARQALRGAAINNFLAAHPSALSRKAAHVFAIVGGAADLINATTALKKKPASAMRTMERLMRKDPLNLLFARIFCKAAEQAAAPEAAIQTLEMLREHYPENMKLLLWMSELYKNADRLQDAKSCLETIAKLKPNDAAAARALKDVLALESMSRGGWSEAGKEGGSFRNAIRDAMEAAVLEQGSKITPKAESQVGMLLHDAQAKVNAEPENMTNRRTLSNLFLQANRFDDAIYTLQEGRRLSGTADPQIDRAIAAIRMKQFDHDIGMLVENGDRAGAEKKKAEKQEFRAKDLAEQVERYPNDPHIRFDFGELLLEQDDIDEAIRQFQISQRSPQHRIRSFYYLGLCFMKKGQFDIALEQLEKACGELPQMNETKMEITYAMGEALTALGRREEAVNRYKEIYRVNISYKDVAQKMENAYKKTP